MGQDEISKLRRVRSTLTSAHESTENRPKAGRSPRVVLVFLSLNLHPVKKIGKVIAELARGMDSHSNAVTPPTDSREPMNTAPTNPSDPFAGVEFHFVLLLTFRKIH